MKATQDMTNRNIEDIDQLFRQGLNPGEERYTPAEEEWSALEKRLDRYDRKKGVIIWLTRAGAVAAVILLFVVLGNLLTENRPEKMEQAAVEQKEIKKDSNKILEQQQAQKLPNGPLQPLASPGQEKTALRRPSAGTGIKDNNLRGQKASPAYPVTISAESKTRDSDTLQKENLNLENITEAPVNIAREENQTPAQPATTAQEQPSRAQEPVFATIEEEGQMPEAKRAEHKMALSVMAAPAYNRVSNLNNGSMGNDVGLMVTFQIARNWNFSTGGIYAKKLYEAGFKDYKPKNNIWSEYYPQMVNADCRVLDIPLNLSYTFLRGKGRSVSIGTGLSSYIMLREDYRFTYAETDSNTPPNYRVVNQNQHWLSVVNLQATMEQRLSKRVSISLQPYMKIPLTDIGFAGVKLQSLGMAANLNWNFSL